MQWCVNCGTQAGYLHTKDCPRPKFYGEPDILCPHGRLKMRAEDPCLCSEGTINWIAPQREEASDDRDQT